MKQKVPLSGVRARVAARLDEMKVSLAEASRQMNRNAAGRRFNQTYVQQYVTYAHPPTLSEEAREALAPVLGWHPNDLREPHPSHPRAAEQKEDDRAPALQDDTPVGAGNAPRGKVRRVAVVTTPKARLARKMLLTMSEDDALAIIEEVAEELQQRHPGAARDPMKRARE